MDNTQNIPEQVNDTQNEQVNNTSGKDEQVDNSLEIIETILDDSKDTTEDISDNIDNVNTNIEDDTKDGTKKVSKSIPIIDDNVIAEHPTLKSFKGKSIMELPDYYDNLRRELTKVTQELSEFKKQSIKEPIIDPVEDLEGFKKQQSELKDLTIQEAEKRAEKKAEEIAKKIYNEQLQQKQEAQKAAQQLKEKLKSQLPEGINPENALNLFKENELMQNGKVNEEIVSFYMNHPELFIKHIVKETENALLKENLDKKAKSKAFDILNSNMDKANKSRTQSTKSIITSNEEPSEIDIIANEVFNLSYNPNDFPD